MENIIIKELLPSDINDHLLDDFNRYQKVKRWWIKKDDKWVLTDEEYILDWDQNQKQIRIKRFLLIIKEKSGYVYGAYHNNQLIGFSVLLNKKFGKNEEYVQLKQLHISLDYRHQGLGKKLFEKCTEKAKNIGAKKLYISANDSEETQRFYLSIGCKDAIEINAKCAEEEPYDRQMEYEL
jgi:N-acetylglutamate synthase-like GNAT family acetyltransferase